MQILQLLTLQQLAPHVQLATLVRLELLQQLNKLVPLVTIVLQEQWTLDSTPNRAVNTTQLAFRPLIVQLVTTAL
jgi:hypothetical protein